MALFTAPVPTQKSLSIGLSIVAVAALVALLYFGGPFFITLMVSTLVAFMLDPAVVLLIRLRLSRPFASLLVILITLLAVYALGFVLWGQVARLSADLPTYTSRVSELLDSGSARLDELEKKIVESVVPQRLREQDHQIQQKPQEAMKARRKRAGLAPDPPAPALQEVRIRTEPRPAISLLYGYISRYFGSLLMASFVPFLVYFMLSWRDHFSKSVLHLFPSEARYAVGKSWEGAAESTRAYVLGNLILWILLGAVSTVIFFFLGVPYWALAGPVSAFFSLVPYVGLPLSVLPPVLAALAIPNKFKIVVTVALVTAALHIVALNFLYAKVVGRRVRLNPLVVTIALMFWGALWGGVGLVLAVPITAAVKAVCDNVEPLQPYGKILGD